MGAVAAVSGAGMLLLPYHNSCFVAAVTEFSVLGFG